MGIIAPPISLGPNRQRFSTGSIGNPSLLHAVIATAWSSDGPIAVLFDDVGLETREAS
jgi:hypothetical protein